MKKLTIIFSAFCCITLFSGIYSCQQTCLNNVFYETTKMDLQVNAENLGINTNAPKNRIDTIHSNTNQFYNYPQLQRFGFHNHPKPSGFITSAFAADDCPETQEYTTRLDATKTAFWINVPYDASALGQGTLAAETNLLANAEIKANYLQGFETNPFLLGGAPAPLSIVKDFFAPINAQWITFYFLFVENDGTEFRDSTVAYIDYTF
ncbi:MAG: hypothetical protein R2728_02200 [Chitinophagales bacterium]